MNMVEWRRNEGLVSEAREWLAKPVSSKMVETVLNSAPWPQGDPEDSSYSLGLLVGFHNAMAVLAALGQPLPKQNPVVNETYGGQNA